MIEHKWCWLTHQKIALDNDQLVHEDGSPCTCYDDLMYFAGFGLNDQEVMTGEEAKQVAENMHKINNRHRVGSRVITLREFDD